ncbi:MAG: ParB N-terminal domain-containing protein [Burkholderiales bacterium]|nr:ParB N-terminal domain-containing protein [Burkholderiales bacterium]
MNLVQMKVEDLIPYERNSRTHNEAQIAQLAASIKEFGFTNPVLIDEKNTIIAGEGRVLAAKKLKLETVPCIVLTGLSEAQKAAYVIADNKIALNAGWDAEMLLTELNNISDLDMSLTGFNHVEIMALFEEVPKDLAEVAAGAGAPASNDADWSGMPDFSLTDDKPFRSIALHFPDQAAVDAFAKLVGQNLTDKTKYMWYPLHVKRQSAGMIYA